MRSNFAADSKRMPWARLSISGCTSRGRVEDGLGQAYGQRVLPGDAVGQGVGGVQQVLRVRRVR